jgi:hypothetical protein
MVQTDIGKRTFTLRSMLLVMLVVGLGAGATAFAIGHDLSKVGIGSSAITGTSQQSTTTTGGTSSTDAALHNCTRTSG